MGHTYIGIVSTKQTSHQLIDGLISTYLVCIDRSRLKNLCGCAPPQDGSLQCPSCKTIYGEKTGTQPKGKMEIYSIGQSLPGHPDCGTIQIIYSIPPGIQVGLHTELRRVQSSSRFYFIFKIFLSL